MLHQIKAEQFYTNFLVLFSPSSQSSISEVELKHLNRYFQGLSIHVYGVPGIYHKLIVLENCLSLLEVLEISLNLAQTCLYV